MATAVQPTTRSSETKTTTAGLLVSSVLGAGFLLGGVCLAGYAVPQLLANLPIGGSFAVAAVRILAQLAVVGGLAYIGGQLAGSNPPRGMRGGIFLVLSVVFTVFFITRAVGLNLGDAPAAVAGAAALAGGLRLLTSKTGIGWMQSLEEQGWFHTNSYKRTQGRRVRQWTIMGLLVVGLSGVYSMIHNGTIGSGNLVYNLPFGLSDLTVLTDKQYAVPLLFAAAVLWLAWRAVNIPMFADFLIATEAEMNKVSWSSRKRLVQDTIVVLVTTVLLTAFLLVIDLFWGWLLSDVLSVLPGKGDIKPQTSTQQVDW